MIEPEKFRQRRDALVDLLEARMGVRGKTLRKRLARAGRRLPRGVRRDGQRIVQAERLMDHPRLARLVDPVKMNAAFDGLSAHLKRLDRAEARRTALLSWLAVVIFNLAVLGLLVLAVLRWRGVV